MNFKEILKGKLTDPDHEVFRYLTAPSDYAPRADTLDGFKSRAAGKLPWWLVREYGRFDYEIYEPMTDVLRAINKQNPHFAVHVAVDEPDKVAYTASRADGEADRQLRTTLGRFLAKYYPTLSDHTIASLAADHAADRSLELELLSGQAIVDVYESGVQAACMSKDISQYSLARGHRPAEAYKTDHVYMAVLRNGEGKITERCMVVHLPDKPKRFIRAYPGGGKLQAKLVRLGYKPGGWEGVVFNTISLGESRYVMPYLDGNGVAGSSAVSSVALVDGKITGVSADVYQRLRGIHPNYAYCATSTSGVVDLKEAPEEQLWGVSDLTGVRYSRLADGVQEVQILQNGVEGRALKSETLDWVPVTAVRAGVARVWLVPPDTDTYRHGGALALNDTPTRLYHGYKKLHADFGGTWARASDLVVVGKDADGLDLFAPRENAVEVIRVDADGNTVLNYALLGDIAPEWVKVHSRRAGVPSYAEANVRVVKTTTGRKVVPGIHEVRQLWNGLWAFDRGLLSSTIWGEAVYWTSNYPLSDEHREELRRQRIRSLLEVADAAEVFEGHFYHTYIAGVGWVSRLRELRPNIHKATGMSEEMRSFFKELNVFEAERDALDYSASPELQGAANSTWVRIYGIDEATGLSEELLPKMLAKYAKGEVVRSFRVWASTYATPQAWAEAMAKEAEKHGEVCDLTGLFLNYVKDLLPAEPVPVPTPVPAEPAYTVLPAYITSTATSISTPYMRIISDAIAPTIGVTHA